MSLKGGKYRFSSDIDSIRIDAWLTNMIGEMSRTYIKKLLNDKRIIVNGQAVKPNYKVKKNDIIEVDIPEPEKLDLKPEDIEIDIVYEDDDIIVVNKPKDMVVHPAAGNFTGTLVNGLMYLRGDSLSDINGILRPGIVHRIDKDTTGIIVVAKNNKAHRSLTEKFKSHDIERIYYAMVDGVVCDNRGKIDAPIGRHPIDRKKMAVNLDGGKKAVTHFTVIERFENATLIEVSLETGRTHQIRVHMAYIGHPVLGDDVYGRKHVNNAFNLHSQALHAKSLGFVHPSTGKHMKFETELPEYINRLLQKLRNKE